MEGLRCNPGATGAAGLCALAKGGGCGSVGAQRCSGTQSQHQTWMPQCSNVEPTSHPNERKMIKGLNDLTQNQTSIKNRELYVQYTVYMMWLQWIDNDMDFMCSYIVCNDDKIYTGHMRDEARTSPPGLEELVSPGSWPGTIKSPLCGSFKANMNRNYSYCNSFILVSKPKKVSKPISPMFFCVCFN